MQCNSDANGRCGVECDRLRLLGADPAASEAPGWQHVLCFYFIGIANYLF